MLYWLHFHAFFWSSRRVRITKQPAFRSSLIMEITIIVQVLLDMLIELLYFCWISCKIIMHKTFPFNFSGLIFKMNIKHKSGISLNWNGATLVFAIDSNFKNNKPLKLTKNPSICWNNHILDSSINCNNKNSQPYHMTI